MGFFKNLFKGKFKAIGQNAIKNVASGQLIKGGGLIGGIINGATSKFVKPAASILTKFGIGQGGGSIPRSIPTMGGYRPPVSGTPSAQAKALATAEITQGVAKGEISPEDAQKAMFDINGDGKDDSKMLMIAVGAAAILYFMKKK